MGWHGEDQTKSKATLQREGANTMRAPCAATGKTLAPPTTNTIAMDATNIRHTTEKTEITEPTTATGTTPTSNLKTTSTTAADATSTKQTMDTIFTITARMVTETTTAKASTPAPALATTMMAAADTRAMKMNMDVMTLPTVEVTIATPSMADTTLITSERRPANMKLSTPPQMMTPVLPPVKVAGDIEKKRKCVA